MAPGAGCFAFIVLAPESALLETMAILVEAMTNRIHSFDRVSLFERQVFWGWASGGETFTRFLPHTPFSHAPVPRRWSPESSTTWVERTDWSASSVRLPLGARNSRRGLILPSLLIWSQYDPRGGRCSYWSARSRSLVSTKARNSRTDARAVSRLRDTTAS